MFSRHHLIFSLIVFWVITFSFERKWEILTVFFYEVLCLSSSFLKRKRKPCIRKRVGYLEVSENAFNTNLHAQSCMSCFVVIHELSVFLNIISDDSPPENFETFLETVNKNLRPLYMEIRHGISEEDGSKNYGLVWKIWNSKLIKKSQDFILVHPHYALSHFI